MDWLLSSRPDNLPSPDNENPDGNRQRDMRKQIRTAALAATTALGFAAAPVTEAAAQGYPSYCGGRLQAASFYSTISATSTSSTTSYWLILQNTTGNEVGFAVAFNAHQANNRPNGTHFTMLGRWGTSQSILLGRQMVHNPSGSGALKLSDLPGNTRVTCR